MPPLGIKLSNPGNLRPNDELKTKPFKGQVPIEAPAGALLASYKKAFGVDQLPAAPKNFLKFMAVEGKPAPFWGLRAAAINILAYQVEGLKTLEQLGDKWSPTDDNPGEVPGTYGREISQNLRLEFKTLISANVAVQFNDWLLYLLYCVVINEQGYSWNDVTGHFRFWYDADLYQAAVAAAREEKGFKAP